MKREMDLVRKILQTIEGASTGYAPDPITVEGYTDEQVGYHALLLIDAGLANGRPDDDDTDKSPKGRIIRLTWAGHEFLEASRDPTIWQQASQMVSRVGGATFPTWIEILTQLAARNLGVSV